MTSTYTSFTCRSARHHFRLPDFAAIVNLLADQAGHSREPSRSLPPIPVQHFFHPAKVAAFCVRSTPILRYPSII